MCLSRTRWAPTDLVLLQPVESMLQLSIDICHPRPSCSKPAACSCCLLAVDRRDRQTHVTNDRVATRLLTGSTYCRSVQFSSVVPWTLLHGSFTHAAHCSAALVKTFFFVFYQRSATARGACEQPLTGIAVTALVSPIQWHFWALRRCIVATAAACVMWCPAAAANFITQATTLPALICTA